MIVKKGILSLILIIFSLCAQSQISRGSLLNNEIPTCIDSFFTENQIKLAVLRNSTAFLTDRDIHTWMGYPVPKRKKAFVRHVKHLSEKLECYYQEGQKVNDDIVEIVYEIALLEASLKQKAIAETQIKVPLKDKIRMILDSYRSKRVFTYQIQTNISRGQGNHTSPVLNSPYYHHVEPDTPLHKQFGYLADLKKIDPEKKMVVLFKELSLSGSAPKIRTMDRDLDNEWSLKWGDEVHTDVVGSRIFAALGFDVDHPYFYEKDKLTLVFDDFSEVNDAEELVQHIDRIYDVDLVPFISNHGVVTEKMAEKDKDLRSFIGKQYVRFLKCAVEARPDRVKRIRFFSSRYSH